MGYIRKSLLSLTLITSLDVCLKASEAQILIDHVQKSIQAASLHQSKLTRDILNISGMSSHKGRHLLNNLCSLPGARYLEIGVWRGSTFIAALYKNNNTLRDAVAIDNWSEFENQRNNFKLNTATYLPKDSFKIYECDAFDIDVTNVFLSPINIYFYDGNHSEDSQYKAFTHFNAIFADTFIAIIDDWNYEKVKTGTQRAFDLLKYKILFKAELSSCDGCDPENWWHGMCVVVIQKGDQNKKLGNQDHENKT